MVEGEGGGEVSPWPPGVKGDPNNLAVNPTQGSSDKKAAWESFRDTGCRKNSQVMVSCTV